MSNVVVVQTCQQLCQGLETVVGWEIWNWVNHVVNDWILYRGTNPFEGLPWFKGPHQGQ
jgi:hypothetical protein